MKATKQQIRHGGETLLVPEPAGYVTDATGHAEQTLLDLARDVHGQACTLRDLWQQAGRRTRGLVPERPNAKDPRSTHDSLLECLRAIEAVLAEQTEAARELLGRLGE